MITEPGNEDTGARSHLDSTDEIAFPRGNTAVAGKRP